MVGLWFRLAATRDAIGRHLATDDLPDRDPVLAWTDRRAPLFEALLTARDAAPCDAVMHLIAEDDPPNSIAVIYGAGNRSVLAHIFDRAGFRTADSRWMTV